MQRVPALYNGYAARVARNVALFRLSLYGRVKAVPARKIEAVKAVRH